MWKLVAVVAVIPSLITSGAAVAGSTGAAAQDGAAPAEPSTIEALEQAFRVGQVHSDFVVVIDTSGSMGQGPDPLYPKVQDAFGKLVDALPDGDRLTVVTFDSIPTVTPPIVLSAENRESSKKLTTKLGDSTDIGAALNKAVEQLDRPDAPDVQTVVFITDGKHEAPAFSAFRDVGSQAWQDAKTHASILEQRRTVQVRAFGLGEVGKAGAELANQVFANTEVVQVEGAQIGDYLTTEVRNARLRVLGKVIQEEIDKNPIAIQVKPPADLSSDLVVTVQMTSTMPHLGADVNLDRVAAVDFKKQPVRSSIVGGARTLHLAPGGTQTFDVLLKPDLESTSFLQLPPQKREEIDIQLDLTQTAQATPTDLLHDRLGVKTAVPVGSISPFTSGRTIGNTWAQFLLRILIIAATVALVCYMYARFIRKPRLVGALAVHGAIKGTDEPLRLRGKEMKIETNDLGGFGTTKVKFFTRRGRRKQVFVERLGGEGAFELKIHNRWAPVEAGSKLTTGEYRYDGEGGTRFYWSFGEET